LTKGTSLKPNEPTHTSTPTAVVRRAIDTFQQFAQTEAAGGVVLLAFTAAALAWANSPWSASYFHLWEQKITIGSEAFSVSLSLHHWINDALMAAFFFMVGLEIKREMLVGELSSVRHAALPIAAAAGGMIVPALLYSAVNIGGSGAPGWGIPMATDIAFALGILALLGPQVPLALKIFLAALAIVDDIGAVLVIAIFYTAKLNWASLATGGAILLILFLINGARVRHPAPYAVLGVMLWLTFLHSGIHATIAGVVLAMTIPASTRIDETEFVREVRASLDSFQAACGPGTTVLSSGAQQEAISDIEDACEGALSPLMRLEHSLHGLVAFGIMPLFALANAGVRIDLDTAAVTSPIALGVLLGLVIGKPVGITLASWLAVRAGIAVLPAGVTWRSIRGVSCLAGVGFTMSLFIAALAFPDAERLDTAKLAVLGASLLAGVIGWVTLRKSLPRTDAS
jgi:NhaA family Na+:H+ antiporter